MSRVILYHMDVVDQHYGLVMLVSQDTVEDMHGRQSLKRINFMDVAR